MDDTRQDIHTTGVPRICQACEARHRGVCGGLTDKQLVTLADTTAIKTVPAGTELFGMEEKPARYANILKGVVKLSKLLPDGRQQLVGLQFAPDFIGRPFAETSAVTAEAATEVTICTFPRGTLTTMIETSPGLENMLYRQALKELDEAREWMLTLGRRDAEEKLVSFLLAIAIHTDPYTPLEDESPVEIVIPLTRADIADFLGLTIETVSRQFTRLRNEGVIAKLDGRRIQVSSLADLRKLSGA